MVPIMQKMKCQSSHDCARINSFKVLFMTIGALEHFLYDNYSTVGGDGGCRVGEERAGTTSPMPGHKGFKLQ